MGARARQGWVAKLPGPLAGWTAHRDFPVPDAKPFRDRWAALQREDIPVTHPVSKR
jgi:L-lactate dehydrogenase complex protein LldF